MATRSITIINDGETEICVLYRHHDGYPSGHGADIVKALEGKVLVSGFGDVKTEINGAGDLAVQLIAWLKWDATINCDWKPEPINSAGGLYLYAPGTRNIGEDYVYTLTVSEDEEFQEHLHVECKGYSPRESFKGSLSEFSNWIKNPPSDDE
jgi:hypothetical protein